MTTAADDRAAEKAFEASLAGRPVPGEAAGLAAFTRAVRSAGDQPGRPSAALTELLSTGLLTDQSSPSARTAPAAESLPSRSGRSRTRRRFTVIVPAIITKLLSAGVVAQAATGAGVVFVVAAGAGTAGILPDAAQKAFSDVTGISQTVDEQTAAVGDDLSDPAVPPVNGVADDETATGEFDAAAWAAGYDPEVYESFGAWVSAGAHNKAALEDALAVGGYSNLGAMVSAEAKAKGLGEAELADELAEEGLDLEDLEGGDVTDGDETEVSDEDGTAAQDAGDDTTGPGKSAGKASSGKGVDKAHGGKD